MPRRVGRGRRRGGRWRTRRRHPRPPATGATTAATTASAARPPYAPNSATSRDSHERRRLRRAFHAWTGRPRCRSEAPRATIAAMRSDRPLGGAGGGGAGADGGLRQQREPHEGPVRVLGPQRPVAAAVGLDRHVGREADAGGRQGEAGRRKVGGVAGRVVGPPLLDVHLLDGDREGGARVDARRRPTVLEAGEAHVALRDDARGRAGTPARSTGSSRCSTGSRCTRRPGAARSRCRA